MAKQQVVQLAVPAAASIQADFTFDKETKGTCRFNEDGDPSLHKVGSIYIKKTALTQPWPDGVTITIAPKALA